MRSGATPLLDGLVQVRRHTLRPYQTQALEKMREKFRQGLKRVMLMLATGSGKTTIAAEMIRCANERGRRCLFICDRIELIEQASARFDQEGIEHGIIQADHWRWRTSELTQVCSIQTLNRRRIPDFDLVVIDEAHVLHQAHIRMMQEFGQVPFVGLSATPFAKGLGKYFGGMVVGATTAELIDLGFLVNETVFAPSEPDLEGVRTVAGDYEGKGLSEASDKPKLVADIVSTWLELGEGRKTIGFAVDIAHSKHCVADFRQAGVKAAHIDAYTDSEERRGILRDFREGDTQIVFSVDILSKGYDHPESSCLIMARPTKSLILFIQQAGRVLRTAPGKQNALILDHAGNTARHGFITDLLPSELDDGKKNKSGSRRNIPLPKKCRQCHYMKPATVHKCSNCGFAPERQNTVETVEGSLRLVKGKGKSDYSLTDKEWWYSQLSLLCEERGYKPGFAARVFRDKFGHYPDGLIPGPMIEISPAVRSYVKSRLIRWAKGRRA